MGAIVTEIESHGEPFSSADLTAPAGLDAVTLGAWIPRL
jgi:hypothetical protein